MCAPQSERERARYCIKNKAAEKREKDAQGRQREREKHTVVVPQKSSLKYFSFLLGGEGETCIIVK
jgi:hypothetical protein